MSAPLLMFDGAFDGAMRTTLTIDDDVLAATKSMADHENKMVGEVISSLAREALRPKNPAATTRNGILLLPLQPDAKLTTPEMIRALRDETA